MVVSLFDYRHLSLTGIVPSASSLDPLLHRLAHVLLNFTRLPLQTIEELHNLYNNPSNGVFLQRDAHEAFNDFFLILETFRR